MTPIPAGNARRVHVQLPATLIDGLPRDRIEARPEPPAPAGTLHKPAGYELLQRSATRLLGPPVPLRHEAPGDGQVTVVVAVVLLTKVQEQCLRLIRKGHEGRMS